MTSVARGLSLGGRIDYNTKNFLAIDEMKDRRRREKDAAKAKEGDDLFKLYKDFNIDNSVYHRQVQPEVKKIIQDRWANIMRAYNQDPNSYKGIAINEIVQAASELQPLKQRSDSYFAVEKIPANQRTRPQQTAVSWLQNGPAGSDPTQYVEQDPYGSLSVTPGKDFAVGWNVDKGKNYTGEFQGMLKPLLEKSPITRAEKPEISGNVQFWKQTRNLDPVLADQTGGAYLSQNPNLVNTLIDENRDELKAQGKLTREDAEKYVISKWMKEASAPYMTKEEAPIHAVLPRPKGAGKEDKTTQNVTPVNNMVVQVAEASGKVNDVTVQKGWQFNAVSLQHAPEKVYNVSTGKEERVPGSREYQINGVAKVDVATTPDGTKYILELLPKQIQDQVKKTKGVKVANETYAFGLEKAGTAQGMENWLPRALKMTPQLQKQLKDKKVNMEGLDENVPQKTSKDNTKSQIDIPKVVSQAEYDAIPSGGQYYAPDGSLRKKK